MASGEPCVAVCDGSVIPSCLTSEEFLLNHDRGSYTVCRTVDGHSVFEFIPHVERIAMTARLMIEQQFKNENRMDEFQKLSQSLSFKNMTSAHFLFSRVKESLEVGIKEFQKRHNSEGDPERFREKRCTVLMTWDDDITFTLRVHVQGMNQRPPGPVAVDSIISARENPVAKDSKWLRERKKIESLTHVEISLKTNNEMLLLNEKLDVFEGLSSNFFAVVDGEDGEYTIQVAPKGSVLEGTVMRLVLIVCEMNGIRVSRDRFPNLNDLFEGKWRGCFITSTSRLVVPVHTFIFEEKRYDIPQMDLVSRILKLVIGHMKEESVRLLD